MQNVIDLQENVILSISFFLKTHLKLNSAKCVVCYQHVGKHEIVNKRCQ